LGRTVNWNVAEFVGKICRKTCSIQARRGRKWHDIEVRVLRKESCFSFRFLLIGVSVMGNEDVVLAIRGILINDIKSV
jgi:hypothetical protein